ncbi:MAG: outer membrane lipoprotein carrier protein LolA [Bacteroidales bacterium]|nr:outer membrane lipoprotein carrier protein LolA [Bacteroidales bacterium]
MFKLVSFIVALIVPVHIISQENQITQDPVAGKILDRMALKTQAMQSMQADFELVIEDRKEKTKNISSGNVLIKKNKYKINSQGSTVYFNGKTMWTYIQDNNEVTITEPDTEPDDFLSNPSAFFTLYKRDFKYRYVQETTMNGAGAHEIDLFPKNLNQPYSRIKVFIGSKSDLPMVIKSVGKDGVDYTVTLKNLLLDKETPDAVFTFDASKFKKVEIVDMRGVE